MTLVEENNLIDPNSLKNMVRIFYFVIAIVAGGSQYGLAVYYRSAQARSSS